MTAAPPPQGRAGGVEVVEPSDEGGRDPHPHVHAKKSARTTSASYQAAEHNAKAIIVYNLCSAISIGTALGPFFEKYVLQVQQELGSRVSSSDPDLLDSREHPNKKYSLLVGSCRGLLKTVYIVVLAVTNMAWASLALRALEASLGRSSIALACQPLSTFSVSKKSLALAVKEDKHR